MVSVANLVFLLLIFFILTSALVSPNAIKLLLPSSSGKIISKQSATISISDSNKLYVNDTPVTETNLQELLAKSLIGQNEGVIVIRADKTAPVQSIVSVIDVVNQMNKMLGTKHKVILATTPKE